MNPIHDNEGNLLAVEINNTRISAEALARMAATNERYRAALYAIANALVCDPATFARAVADGAPLQAAIETDLTWLETPAPPEVAVSLLRIDARRELVKAALALHSREQEAIGLVVPSPAYRAWQNAEMALYKACNTFLALGGSEVEG